MITLSDPDISQLEIESVSEVLRSPRISHGSKVEEFETAFAAFLGRKHAIAVHSGILGNLPTVIPTIHQMDIKLLTTPEGRITCYIRWLATSQ